MKGYSNASVPPFGYCRGTCFQCADNNGDGYCPRFGSTIDLWRELGDNPKVFVPHPIDQYAVQVAYELHIRSNLADGDIARCLSKPHPDEMKQLNLDSRTLIKPLEDGSAIVVLDNGIFAFQHADGRLRFFRPQGRPGEPNPEGRFTKDTVRDMLQNPYYAGFVVYRQQKKEKGMRRQNHKRSKMPLSEMSRRNRKKASQENDHGLLLPGLHIPLIDINSYERSQQRRGTRGCNPSNENVTRRIYPLGGTLKCVRCGYAFRGNAGNGNVRYYDDGGQARGVSKCTPRSLRADDAESIVFAEVERLHIPEELEPGILAYLCEGPEWDEVRRQRRSVHSRLSSGREMKHQKILSEGEFIQLQQECSLRLRQLEQKVQFNEEAYRVFVRDFPRLWAAATDEERKGLILSIFGAIWVQDGEIVGYQLRQPFKEALPGLKSFALGCECDHVPNGLAQLPPP